MQVAAAKSPLANLFAKLESCKDKDGYTLVEHLKEMFNRILLKPAEYPLEKFEDLSYLIKLTHLRLKPPMPDHEVNKLKAITSETQEWIQRFLTQLKPEAGIDIYRPMGFVPNVLAEAKMFEWAGVSLGEETWYLISKAVKRLAVQTNASRIRFWGKFLCRDRDIYVIEAKANPDEDYASIPGEESRGKGLNENVYWVTSDILGEWQKLPDVQAKDIVDARALKKAMTGNLDAPVNGYPFFTGKERNFLRAQIARITATTVIAPAGVFQASEANNREIEYVKDQAVPGYAELKGLDKWVHQYASILKNGRTEHVAPPGSADPEAALEKEKENDPYIDRLRPISEDEKFGAYETAWLRTIYGDEQQYAQPPPKDGTTSYACIALRPFKWPGALTVYQNGKWQSIYVGYGIPQGGDPYVPIGPPGLLGEPEDLEEMPEPNPQKLPEQPAEQAENPDANSE